MEEKSGITRRKALAGLSGLGIASAGAGAGTLAYFSDSSTVSDSSIESGSIEIDVDDGTGFQYTYEGVAPGDGPGNDVGALTLNADIGNEGSVEADYTGVFIEHEMDWSGSPTPNSDEGMENYLDIDEFRYGLDGPTFYILDGAATQEGAEKFESLEQGGPATVADISEEVTKLEPTPDPGTEAGEDGATTFTYDFEVSEDLPNEFQGAELETTIHFALLQDEDQEWEPDN